MPIGVFVTEKSMRKAILLFLLLSAACGGGPAPAMISLQAAGVNPSTISVAGGAQLQFINSDAIDHGITSNDCPELDSPIVVAGSSFTATLGSGPKTCGFADALQPSVAAFQGTVYVGKPSSGGGGGGYGGGYGH